MNQCPNTNSWRTQQLDNAETVFPTEDRDALVSRLIDADEKVNRAEGRDEEWLAAQREDLADSYNDRDSAIGEVGAKNERQRLLQLATKFEAMAAEAEPQGAAETAAEPEPVAEPDAVPAGPVATEVSATRVPATERFKGEPGTSVFKFNRYQESGEHVEDAENIIVKHGATFDPETNTWAVATGNMPAIHKELARNMHLASVEAVHHVDPVEFTLTDPGVREYAKAVRLIQTRGGFLDPYTNTWKIESDKNTCAPAQ